MDEILMWIGGKRNLIVHSNNLYLELPMSSMGLSFKKKVCEYNLSFKNKVFY